MTFGAVIGRRCAVGMKLRTPLAAVCAGVGAAVRALVPFVRLFFDLPSPVVGCIAVPRPYVILQRINLGPFAVLGELYATADWRAISEEIWPCTHGPASTPLGRAEAAWRVRHPGDGCVTGLRSASGCRAELAG